MNFSYEWYAGGRLKSVIPASGNIPPHFHIDTASGGSFSDRGSIFGWFFYWGGHVVVDVILGQTALSGGIYRR